jgi:hypothetical protein
MSGTHPDERPSETGEPALDELLRALAGTARPDELTGEDQVVTAMRARLVPEPVTPTSKETTMHASPTRRARIGTIAAAAVIALGGVAAAAPPDWVPGRSGPSFLDQLPEGAPPEFEAPPMAPAVADEPESTTTVVATTTTAVPTTSTTMAPTLVPETSTTLVDDPDTEFDETQCAEGNHGRTVSSVAISVEPGPDHGAAVSEAAHSSCGKTPKADDESDESDEADEGGKPDDAGRPDHAGKPDDPGSNGRGNGSHKHGDD